MRFTLTASRASASALTVNVEASQTGSFLLNRGLHRITIAARTTTQGFTLRTEDDLMDEPNGTVRARVLPGTGYRVGRPFPAAVAVEDNDLSRPPRPSGVSASSASDGSATVRWSHRSGTEAYNVQYRRSGGIGWRSVFVNVSSPGPVADLTTITGLRCETRYRFRVRAWSDGIAYREAWGPYSDVIYATTGDCIPTEPPEIPTPAPVPPTPTPPVEYAPLEPPLGPALECRSFPGVQFRKKHSGPRVSSADGRHQAQVELYSTRLAADPNSYCIEARFISESTPGADEISWGGKLYKIERFLDLEGLSPGEIGLIDRFTLLDRYEDQPLSGNTSYFRMIERSCETCRGGTIQTYRAFVETRLLKVPTIYARGEHAFSVGGAPVAIASGVEWTMPPAGVCKSAGVGCLIELHGTIEAELSEDVDTGLLGDLIGLITAIARWLDES